MSIQLPHSWHMARFDTILERVERKFTIEDAAEYDCVGVRWYGLGAFVRERQLGMNIARKQQWMIKQGDVIYNKLFAWKGSFAIADSSIDGCIVSDKFPTYRVNSQLIHSSYLGYYFQTHQIALQAQNLSKGAAAISKLTLNPPQFWELEIPLPPLDEQHRIVSRVKALAARIAEAHGLRQQALEEASLLFHGDLDRIVKELYDNHKSKLLCDLVDQNRGISYGIVQTGEPFDGGIPTLRAGDIRQFSVNADSIKQVDPYIEAKYQRTRLQGNELLLRIRGGLGEVAVCPDGMIGGNVSREIAVIPLLDDITPEFGMYVLAAPINQAVMQNKARGTSYIGINLKDVRRLTVPTPSIEIQRKVVSYLDQLRMQVDKLKHLQAETAAELDALLPAVLDRAFKGEL